MKYMTLPLKCLFFVLFGSTSFIRESSASSFTVEKLGAGKAVIMIPGLMSDVRVWSALANKLKGSHQLHLVTISGMANNKQGADLAGVKNDLLDYVKRQNLERPIIIGHSLGGFLGLWLATSAPLKIGPVISVDGLPFIGPLFTGTNSTAVQDLAQHATKFSEFFRSMSNSQLRAYAKNGLSMHARNQKFHESILTMAEKSNPQAVANFTHNLMSTDLRPELRNITQPVLVLGASGASKTEQEHLRVRQLFSEQLSTIDNVKLAINKEALHFIMFDDPNWLEQEVLAFLSEVK